MPVQYIGSPYHKRYHWFGQSPQLRSDKTECPPDVTAAVTLFVLQRDIQLSLDDGLHSQECDGDHPRYVWGRSMFVTASGVPRTVVWEARSSNRESPHYHAYPIQRHRHHDSMPFRVFELLWPEN